MKNKYFITTPIYYVNDVPHIGHTCTTVTADIIARYHKLLGEDVFFLTGTDEHGNKVAQEALAAGLSPKEFCDRVSQSFKEIWPKLNIQYDYFIRTTDPQHEKIASKVVQKLYDKGFIYKGTYEGYYCLGCEKFLNEKDLIDGKCPLHPNREPQHQKEENYFFKLSSFKETLIKAISNQDDPNHYEILPESKKNEILRKLNDGLDDISISREKVSWGIPCPWDKKHTIYVWVEALLNYYTATQFVPGKKEFWPADLHTMAKDILWFHTVIWEALLIAAELPVPKKIFIHSFYMIDGQKMSKSLGNVISPQQLLEKFGADATRYLIASSFPYDKDSDVGIQKFTEKYNADLANGLGNLVARVARLAEKSEKKFEKKSFSFDSNIAGYLDKYQLTEALTKIWEKIRKADQIIDQEKPWKLEGSELFAVLQKIIFNIQEISFDIKPFMPETAEKIEKQFAGPKIKSEPPLFPRLK